MAEVTPPLFMDVDFVYSGDELGLPHRDLIGEGICGATHHKVSQRAAGANMSVDVAAGASWVLGDDATDRQPNYRCRSDSIVNLAISAAHATLPRIDRVIAECLDATFSGVSRLWRLRVVTGTPTAGATLVNLNGAAAVPVNAYLLADVLVPAASASVVDANIADRRRIAQPGQGQGARPQRVTSAELTILQAAAILRPSEWDGFEVELAVDTTLGIYWRFRFRNAGLTYPWEFVGGSAAYAEIATAENTASATYVDLTTPGPSIVVPRAGDYLLKYGCDARKPAVASQSACMAPKLGAAATADAERVFLLTTGAGQDMAGIARAIRRTLAAGDTIKAQYRADGGGASTFVSRWLEVTPVRVS